MSEKVAVLDRGNVEFVYPGEWILARSPQGYVTLCDPGESCRLEVSYTRLPPEAREIAPEELLKRLLTHVPEAGASPAIHSRSEANFYYAWTDYTYPSTDKRSGQAMEAHGRWLLGSNGVFQALVTFYYWAEDAGWAVPAWERIVETLQLGDGSQLARPEEHWSRRRKH